MGMYIDKKKEEEMRGRVLEGVIFTNPRWINRYTLVHVDTSNKIFNIQRKKLWGDWYFIQGEVKMLVTKNRKRWFYQVCGFSYMA